MSGTKGVPIISSTAIIRTDRVGSEVSIGDHVIIGSNAAVGSRVIIHPNVMIEDSVEIGDDVEINAGSIIGKEPKSPGTLCRTHDFEPVLRIGNRCQIGVNSIVYFDVIVEESTLIGDGAVIREKCRVGKRCVIGQNSILGRDVIIEDQSRITGLVNISGGTRIGKRVYVAAGVMTADSNDFGTASSSRKRWSGVTLDDDCRVGIGAVLLPGITVGKLATVAAGAVVTRDVVPNTTVMGVPARTVEVTGA